MRRVDQNEFGFVVNEFLYLIEVNSEIILAPEPIEARFHTKQSSFDRNRRIKRERRDDVRSALGRKKEQDQQRFRRSRNDVHVFRRDAVKVGDSLSKHLISLSGRIECRRLFEEVLLLRSRPRQKVTNSQWR